MGRFVLIVSAVHGAFCANQLKNQPIRASVQYRTVSAAVNLNWHLKTFENQKQKGVSKQGVYYQQKNILRDLREVRAKERSICIVFSRKAIFNILTQNIKKG